MAAILVSSPAAYSSASLRPECHIQPSQMEQRCEINTGDVYWREEYGCLQEILKPWAISLDV